MADRTQGRHARHPHHQRRPVRRGPVLTDRQIMHRTAAAMGPAGTLFGLAGGAVILYGGDAQPVPAQWVLAGIVLAAGMCTPLPALLAMRRDRKEGKA